ncbi:hypothetical protein A2U01_0114902, partial [Trifolium medium]|nr:hypothetical protein [Trifolium medium]
MAQVPAPEEAKGPEGSSWGQGFACRSSWGQTCSCQTDGGNVVAINQVEVDKSVGNIEE